MPTGNITLTANVADVEVLAALFEDKAAHSLLVAEHQRSRKNEEGAARAEARAEMLRRVGAPLFEEVARQKRERAEARLQQEDAAREAREAARHEAEAARVAKLNAKREAKVASKSAGDAIRAMVAKSASKRHKVAA